MPPWSVLPEKERWNLVAYIKTFAADKFKEAPKKLELPKEVASSDGVHQARQGDVRGDRVQQVPRQPTGRADGPSRPS